MELNKMTKLNKTDLLSLEEYSERREELRAEVLQLKKDRLIQICLLYTSPSPRDLSTSRMPSSA